MPTKPHVRTRPRRPARGELRRRARLVKLVLTDSDGVLTDTGVYYGESGEIMKRFSIRDGMGVELLRMAGIETAIITGELSESVRQRAKKLKMPFLYLGVSDKHSHLPTILAETGCKASEVAFIGDDVNDLGLLRELAGSSLTGAPGDATTAVQRIVHYRTRARAGYGAFREFAEWILSLRR